MQNIEVLLYIYIYMYISSIGIYIHTHSPAFTAAVGDIYIYMPHPTRCPEAVKDEGTIGRPGVQG